MVVQDGNNRAHHGSAWQWASRRVHLWIRKCCTSGSRIPGVSQGGYPYTGAPTCARYPTFPCPTMQINPRSSFFFVIPTVAARREAVVPFEVVSRFAACVQCAGEQGLRAQDFISVVRCAILYIYMTHERSSFWIRQATRDPLSRNTISIYAYSFLTPGIVSYSSFH